jgi:hypothetical protein
LASCHTKCFYDEAGNEASIRNPCAPVRENNLQEFISKRMTLLLVQFLPFAFLGCVQPDNSVRPVAKSTPAKIGPVSTAAAEPTQTTTGNSASVTGSCPAGSEPAKAELRECCRTRNWGKACDGGCWAAGVGEKLAQMCNGAKSAGNDCGSSPARTQTREWCNFHFNRRYCGISDAEWVQTCTPAAAATAAPVPSPAATATANSAATAPCKITQNRGFPYPPCMQRKTAKLCEEGTEGKEEGKYCVWTGP